VVCIGFGDVELCDCADLDRLAVGAGVFVGGTCGDVLITAEYGGGGASEALSVMAFADLLLRWEDVNVDVSLIVLELVLCRVRDVRRPSSVGDCDFSDADALADGALDDECPIVTCCDPWMQIC